MTALEGELDACGGAGAPPTATARLKQVFPTGVCDWSKPGVEQQPMAGTWQALPAKVDNLKSGKVEEVSSK